jgi:hypothetical protein
LFASSLGIPVRVNGDHNDICRIRAENNKSAIEFRDSLERSRPVGVAWIVVGPIRGIQRPFNPLVWDIPSVHSFGRVFG